MVKTSRIQIIGMLAFLLIIPSILPAQTNKATMVQIREIGKYVNNPMLVTAEGITGEIQTVTPAIKAYMLSTRFPNDEKDKIWVKTSAGRPDTDATYRVTGTVIREGGKLFLLEQSRERIQIANANSNKKNDDNQESDNKSKKDSSGDAKSKLSSTTMIGGGLIVLAVIFGIVILVNTRRQSARQKMALEQQRQSLEKEKELLRKDAANPKKPVATTVASDLKPGQPKKKQHTVEAWGQLKVTSGPHSGLIFPLSGRQVAIGRETGDLLLPLDSMVSSEHGEIVATNDSRLLFVDKSRNGSVVDGTPIHRGQVELMPNSIIEIGSSRIEVMSMGPISAGLPSPVSNPNTIDTANPSAGSKLTMLGDLQPTSNPGTDGSSEAEFIVVSGVDSGKRFQIRGGKSTIGRREDQDIVLTDDFVSRQHGECVKQGNTWIWHNISDKGSIVNGEKLSEVVIKNGDKIAIGSTILEFCTTKQEVSRSTPTMYDA